MNAVKEKIAGLAAPVPETTDEMMADAVRACHEAGQKSAGLFLRTVPQCMVTWATQGQTKYVLNGAGHKESTSEKIIRTVAERVAKGQNPFG